MIHNFAISITEVFVKREIISAEDDEIYSFGFECMLATALQTTILILAGLILGQLVPLALFTAGFVAVKRHIGGYHANSHFSCILISSTLSIASVYLAAILPLWTNIIFLAIAFTTIWIVAPIQHINNPKTDKELAVCRSSARKWTLIIAVVSLALLISPLSQYSSFLTFGLFMASFSLLIPNR